MYHLFFAQQLLSKLDVKRTKRKKQKNHPCFKGLRRQFLNGDKSLSFEKESIGRSQKQHDSKGLVTWNWDQACDPCFLCFAHQEIVQNVFVLINKNDDRLAQGCFFIFKEGILPLLYILYNVQPLVSLSTKHFLIACFHKWKIIPSYWLLALIHNCKDWIGLWQLFRLDHQGDQVHNCTIKVISQSVRNSNRLKGDQRHSRRH